MKRRDFVKNCVLCASVLPLCGCNKLNNLTENNDDEWLSHIEIHLVEHCNLNCKYCSHFSNIAEEEYYDKSEYKKDLARIAHVTKSKIHTIQLLGGEPLLHPDIEYIFDVTRKYFPHSAIDLLTNATLIDDKPPSFWQNMSKNNIYFVPSIYPINLNWKSILSKAEKYNVHVTTDGRGENITLENIEEHKNMYFGKLCIDLEGKQDQNQKCIFREGCANYVHGKLYPCFAVCNIKHFNKKFNQNVPVTKEDYIDVYKVKNRQQLIDFVRKPTPFCKYCRQYCDGQKWEASKEHSIDEWIL